MNIAIIGGGIAGAAASFEIARQGERATLFHDVAGASSLYSGALDFEAWDRATTDRAISRELAAFARELGVWSLEGRSRRVATAHGNLRPTRGTDQALLDLEGSAGKRVAVVDIERDDWDAPSIAKSLAASDWARKSGTTFHPAALPALEHGFERRISAYDFAVLHDAPERARRLLAALQTPGLAADAWLFGPWLGIERNLAQELSAALALPVGETTSAPGGAAGARFERARDGLLARLSTVEHARITRITPQARGYGVEFRTGPSREFAIVILATGGVAAGGIVLERSFERRGGTGFGLSFQAPFPLELRGEVLEGVSSLSSFDFSERGLGALLEVGLRVHPDGSVPGFPGLFAAGDAVAAKPRAALCAAEAGLLAARSALDFARHIG